ncbi:MAG: hypothetical protein WCE64_12510 [Bacteroidales bacterium]
MKTKKGLIRTGSVLCMLLISLVLSSQEKTKIDPYIQLIFFNRDGERSLETTLTYSSNRMEIPLSGMEVKFYSGSGKKSVLAGIRTDEKGVAVFPIGKDPDLLSDKKGDWTFSTGFAGNDTVNPVESEITVKDINLEVSLVEADSVKKIMLKAFTREGSKMIPVQGEVVVTYVVRMFSLLPMGESTLDENGNAELEFPNDLPGDKEGNLTIISRIEESPLYGTVENRTVRKWGIPTSYSVPGIHRALWTKTPPMWMIITLSVLLTGVWGHYLFAIISLILIRRDAKKKKVKKETNFAR